MALTVPRLLVVADRGVFASDEAYVAAVASLSPGLVGAGLQVRIKSGDVAGLAARVRLVAAPETLVVLNGPVEAAVRLGFGGAHLPQVMIPAEAARVPPGFVLGASVHDAASLAAAERAGAHYVVFGPVWSPGSKVADPVGLAALASVAASARVPVFAIGGVTPERVGACLDAGAHGVAVVSGVWSAPDRMMALEAYREGLRPVPPGP